MRKKILVLYTGGTIGMYKDKDGSLKPLKFEQLEAQIPELKQFDYYLNVISLEQPLDSSNMTPKDWVNMASIIYDNYKNHDGFVVLHGSDTMAYTASALSFMLENLNKPVILTGAQLPIGIRRTDAKENLISAIEIAADSKTPEVCVYFEYKLFRGNRTTKVNAEHFDAFKSPNFPDLAEAGVKIKYLPISYKEKKDPLILHKHMLDEIALLKIYPGMSQNYVKAVLNSPCKAVVLESFGAGNAPTTPWFIDYLKQAIEAGKIVLNTSQCLSGAVSQGLYETSSKLESLGVIGAKDMTKETALAKLMFLLGQRMSNKEVKKQLQISLRGELTN